MQSEKKKPRQFVGFDTHKKFVYGAIGDKEGNKLFEKKFKTEPHELHMFLPNGMKKDSISVL